MSERAYWVDATVRVSYEVEAESPEAAEAEVRSYGSAELMHPGEALRLVSIDETNCYEEDR
ncbi:hypothetical protein GCM10027447_12620 [Glycomyces halotolerans]